MSDNPGPVPLAAMVVRASLMILLAFRSHMAAAAVAGRIRVDPVALAERAVAQRHLPGVARV